MKKQRIAAILLAGVMTCSMMGGSTVLASSETEMTSETETAGEAQEPLVIADQGIFSAGGVTITSDGTFNPEDQWEESGAGQTAHVDHANVLYQIPEEETGLPMVFLHGYGQSRMGWMTTPDGREG